MKHSYRFFMILLALTLVIAISMTARAEDVTESGNLTDTVRYTLYADGTLVIEGTGEVEELEEYPIGDFTALEIGEGISGLTYFWHNSKYNITRLSIPSTMKQMEYVFEACYALTDLELNEGIEVIGRSAFCNCTTLETVVFPSTVTEIGYKAFTNCWELKEVIFTGGPAAVSEVAFYNEMDNESLTVYYPADSGWPWRC